MLTKNQSRLIAKEYHDISLPGSYQSPLKFFQAYKQRHPASKVTLRDVKEWIKAEDTYTLNKEYRGKFVGSNVVVAGLNDIWEADLADLSKFSKVNDNYRYLVGVIDVFSRKLYVRPVKNKHSQAVIDAFISILSEAGVKCNKLRTDMGSEFTNSLFAEFLRQEGISHYFSHGTAQCPYIERVWKTIKKRITKVMFHKQSKRYIDYLKFVVSSYNNTVHSIIGVKPNEVSIDNEEEVRYNQYLAREKRGKRAVSMKVNYKYRVGDIVRIIKRKEKIGSEYKERWTRETYRVVKRVNTFGVPMYTISDLDGEEIAGNFYEQELQEVKPEIEGKMYEIDSVLKHRIKDGVKEVLVSWKGYNKKFNTWIPESEIEERVNV